MYRQKRDRNKDRKSTKKPERNFWMWKHSNWNRKFTRGIQRQIWAARRKNQWPWRQDNGSYGGQETGRKEDGTKVNRTKRAKWCAWETLCAGRSVEIMVWGDVSANIHEALRTPRGHTLRHTTVQRPEPGPKDRKGSRKKATRHKKSSKRWKADFSSETSEARRQLAQICKVLRGKKLSTRNPISGKTAPQKWGRNRDVPR